MPEASILIGLLVLVFAIAMVGAPLFGQRKHAASAAGALPATLPGDSPPAYEDSLLAKRRGPWLPKAASRAPPTDPRESLVTPPAVEANVARRQMHVPVLRVVEPLKLVIASVVPAERGCRHE